MVGVAVVVGLVIEVVIDRTIAVLWSLWVVCLALAHYKRTLRKQTNKKHFKSEILLSGKF